ncbi:MAG: ExeM/NucH family extracellular endonuclease [Nocardioides sp.]
MSRVTARPLALPALGVALVAASLTVAAAPAPAQAASTTLVINEVYVNGGSSGAAYTNKYVEIRNLGDAAVDLAGMSIQYRAPGSTGNSTGRVSLTGTIPPSGYFTLAGGSNGANGVAVPGQDQQSNSFNPGGGGGTVTLVSGTAAVDPSSSSDVVDKIGYGTSNTPEGDAPQAGPGGNSVTTSLARLGEVDTDVNSVDFAAATPTPDADNSGEPDPEPDPDPVAVTIAEIQGTGPSTPMPGALVTTTGLVTAAYPTGGYGGFYLQTGGTGGATDLTPGASDAIFVYAPSLSAGEFPHIGDSLEVTGDVTEFGGLTEISATAAGIAQIEPNLPVIAQPVLPGTECALPGTGCLSGAALDAAREAHEGELFHPSGAYTVTDSYDGSAFNGGGFSSAMFGEIGLAAESDVPLFTVTEVVDAQDAQGVAARTAYNNAHRVILDDGASITYSSAANTGKPFPYFTRDHTVRVGAAVTFPAPLVLDYRFGWKLQPRTQVVGEPNGLVDFEQDRPAAPEDVGGDLTLGTFNVLNYFTTLGADLGTACTRYNDREGNPVTVNSCPGAGPRGAWDDANFQRQQAKIVNSINALGADVVSLEEIENSAVVDGVDRDEALETLVAALNADAGETRWAFVDSPATVPADEDVIRTAFIYDPETTALVGDAEILVGEPAFDNAREPLAQAFKAIESPDADGFVVIANHFKSKGSGTPDPDGQGDATADRIAQAQALVAFADAVAADRGLEKIFLTGDFNAYAMEDPVQEIEAAGYEKLESTSDPSERSYNFDGAVGSLDHVFANEAAAPDVTGVDIWTTNAYESVYYEYSRYNYNVTALYDESPYRASDHNPEIVGINVPDAEPVERVASTLEVSVSPDPLVVGSPGVLRVEVDAAGTPPDGVVIVVTRDDVYYGIVSDGVALVEIAAFDRPGTHHVWVAYSGSERVKGSVVEVKLKAKKPKEPKEG